MSKEEEVKKILNLWGELLEQTDGNNILLQENELSEITSEICKLFSPTIETGEIREKIAEKIYNLNPMEKIDKNRAIYQVEWAKVKERELFYTVADSILAILEPYIKSRMEKEGVKETCNCPQYPLGDMCRICLIRPKVIGGK